MRRFIILIAICFTYGSAFAASSIDELKKLVDQGNYAVASETGEELLLKQPGNARIQFLTAFAYQQDHNNQKAAEHYKELILQHPELPEPRNNLAMIFIADGDYEKASQLLVDAINTQQSYAIAYQNLNRIYASMASEAYKQAVNESAEPPKRRPLIELTALSELESIDASLTSATPPVQNKPVDITSKQTVSAEAESQEQKPVIALTESSEQESVDESITPVTPPVPDTQVDIANFETQLIEQVNNWAKAWGNKDIETYADFYSSEYKKGFKTHDDWVEHRRERIMRPKFIKIEVSNVQIRTQSENQAIIEFEQSYESPNYSDRVMKRLALSRIGSHWKITQEKVISGL